ncbi:hypothetical protein ACJJIF_09780 [Microbulbifer sp. SSSA002]
MVLGGKDVEKRLSSSKDTDSNALYANWKDGHPYQVEIEDL